MTDSVYEYGGGLYVNLTNRCPCRCTFCIRAQQEGLGSSQSLWLEHEPTAAEVIRALGEHDLSRYGELIFCGYGEPFCALDTMLEVCRYVKSLGGVRLRVNTNGLGDLIQKKPTAPLLEGLMDTVSVSLNAPTAARYAQVTQPAYGEDAFAAMLTFATDCRRFVPDVRFTVVDIITPDEVAACRALADAHGIPLRVRHFET